MNISFIKQDVNGNDVIEVIHNATTATPCKNGSSLSITNEAGTAIIRIRDITKFTDT